MTIKWVKKSSGYVQKFGLKKLARSIANALKHCEAGDEKLANRLAHETAEYLEGRGKEVVQADEIRQAVSHIMKQDGHAKGAAAYELTSLHIHKAKIKEVVKRGGARQEFHPYKLFKSIKKSFADAGIDAGKMSEELTKETVNILEKKYQGHKPLPTEEIKKTVAELLKKYGFPKVERSYLLHKYL